MDYTISERSDGLHIEASVQDQSQQKLMAELGKCAAGTCSCPSSQFDKLERIEVAPKAGGVAIDLKAKPGETIDRDAIEKCLAHTTRLIR